MIDETLIDAMLMVGVGILFWIMGYVEFSKQRPISLPKWVLLICGKGNRQFVYLRPFALQMLGLISCVWALVLVIFVSSHEQRVDFFAKGLMVFVIIVAGFIWLKGLTPSSGSK